jgi:hypothetical protein
MEVRMQWITQALLTMLSMAPLTTPICNDIPVATGVDPARGLGKWSLRALQRQVRAEARHA